MESRLDQIRARVEALQEADVADGPRVLFDDLPWLIAEVERLTGEGPEWESIATLRVNLDGIGVDGESDIVAFPRDLWEQFARAFVTMSESAAALRVQRDEADEQVQQAVRDIAGFRVQRDALAAELDEANAVSASLHAQCVAALADRDALAARVERLIELLTIQERQSVERRDKEKGAIDKRIAEIQAAGGEPPYDIDFGGQSLAVGHLIAMGHCLHMAKDPEAVERTLAVLAPESPEPPAPTKEGE